jgi:hypothetical protein
MKEWESLCLGGKPEDPRERFQDCNDITNPDDLNTMQWRDGNLDKGLLENKPFRFSLIARECMELLCF